MTKEYLEKIVANKRSELDAVTQEAEDLAKQNEEATDEAELEQIGKKADELKAKIEDLKKELAEAEAALAEIETPADPEPAKDPEPAPGEGEGEQRSLNKVLEARSLKQITEMRGVKKMTEQEILERATKFAETNKMVLNTRSTLISGGSIATPTGVSGINDDFNGVSSIVDLVKVVDCAGMGSNKVAYQKAGSTAAAQTEGSAAAASDPEFGYVPITPKSKALVSYISNQVRKQTPLNYETKVKDSAYNALRKAAATEITTAIYNSTIKSVKAGTVASTKGVIDEKTLRAIALSYGGDENVVGAAVLFLNKADLLAFGDVRGSDKKPVYEITPDTNNPNTGIIKDGGLAVKYCINSNCNAFAGTAQGSTAKNTMIYGNPACFELDLFGDYEIAVSEDYKFAENMLAVRGSVDLGGDVVVNEGFVVYQVPATA